MVNLTETAALEWGTGALQRRRAGLDREQRHGPLPAEMGPLIRRMATMVPARRLGTESEVAAAIVFLLSPAAAFISGACLRVDGAAPTRVGTGPKSAPAARRNRSTVFTWRRCPGCCKAIDTQETRAWRSSPTSTTRSGARSSA